MTETRSVYARNSLPFFKAFVERSKKRLLTWPERNHWKRYVLGAILSVAGIWSLSAAYLVFTPPRYTSKWIFILPGSGAGVSVSLESIGQTSSLSNSPFASSSLSPKVIYKEIFISDRVLDEAAAEMDMKRGEFGAPQIKLVDETSLMFFEISGRTPELAQKKAQTLIDVFQRQLDLLRRDEIKQRAASVGETIKEYKQNLKDARQNIFEVQQRSGLVSVEQFNEVANSLEQTRKRLSEARADFASIEGNHSALVARLGVSAHLAELALNLSADPVFSKALTDYAELRSLVEGQSRAFGSQNPTLIQSRGRMQASYAILKTLSARAGVKESEWPRVTSVLLSKAREELLKELVAGEAQVEGKRREVEALEKDMLLLDRRIKDLTVNAARLEDLKKDHIIAEAVFSSALARVDTNKADLYASYPIVQVLSPPDLPQKRSQPLLMLALAAGAAGSFLAIAAWTLAWMRQLFVRRSRKAANYTLTPPA